MPTSPSKPLQSSPTKQQTTRQLAPFTPRSPWGGVGLPPCKPAAHVLPALTFAVSVECPALQAHHGLLGGDGLSLLTKVSVAQHTLPLATGS